MSDKLVYDLAQEVEGSPNVFVRKDWLNILDNQNQNYNNNQSIIDTSQLSNSNKYMSYREAYFSIPFLVTLAGTGYTAGTAGPATPGYWTPAAAQSDLNTANKSADYAIGLKNWFGQIIHSFTLDYNGTTIVQQTPFVNMWNSFKLMTSLSYGDLITQGATIGFYPDVPDSWQFCPDGFIAPFGQGVCNNSNFDTVQKVQGAFNNYHSGGGNTGYSQRQQFINFDLDGCYAGSGAWSSGNTNLAVGSTGTAITPAQASLSTNFLTDANTRLVWKSYISKKRSQTSVSTLSTQGFIQYSIVATVYLKHVHSFFNMCPLLKGVFMKMTMNLNNVTSTVRAVAGASGASALLPMGLTCSSVASPLGGVNPLLLSSSCASNGGADLFPTGTATGATYNTYQEYLMNISVGARCLDSTIQTITGSEEGALSKSVYLYIPAYTFNPVFEQAYLSSPVKQIKYTDVYQYQVLNVGAGNTFNNLLTNGIANVKSVLILPFFSSSAGSASSTTFAGVAQNTNTGFTHGLPVFQSPFDTAGTGTTSPLTWISNFNVQVSGQNAIYNMEKYNFEQFNNQLYGANAVNGGLTDGITSGLIDRHAFDMAYTYYYVNIERMLPVEMSVPKSIQILGQNMSKKAVDLYCFVEYGNEISIDALTGARV